MGTSPSITASTPPDGPLARHAARRHRLLEIDYETLVADPEPAIRSLIDFVGLPWDDACLTPQNNTRAIRTASLWQARQPVYRSSVARWQRFEPWLGELRSLAP